jgi:hypothetical protein
VLQLEQVLTFHSYLGLFKLPRLSLILKRDRQIQIRIPVLQPKNKNFVPIPKKSWSIFDTSARSSSTYILCVMISPVFIYDLLDSVRHFFYIT